MTLDPLSRTALIPFWARVQDARSCAPILADRAANALADLAQNRFGRVEVDRPTQVGCCLRNRAVDNWVSALVGRAGTDGPVTIVDLGVGLDTRLARLPDLAGQYIEVDSEPIIRLRDQWIPDTGATRVAGDGMRIADWLEAINERRSLTVIVLEGVLTYQPPAVVRRFFADVACGLPGSYVLFDSLSPLSAWMANRPAALAQGRPRYLWTTWRTRGIRIGAGRLRIHEEKGFMNFPRELTRAFTAVDRMPYLLPPLRRSYRLTLAQMPGLEDGGGDATRR